LERQVAPTISFMGGAPLEDEVVAGASGHLGASQFVHVTRFTVPPGRRAELIEAANSFASSTVVPLERAEYRLLVELEDGAWLNISIANTHPQAVEEPTYLDLAEGILGDEEGVVVATSPIGNGS
jgi:hypothetical protein